MMGKYYDAMYEEFRECVFYCNNNDYAAKKERIDRLYAVLTGVLIVAVFDKEISSDSSDFASLLMLRDTLYDLAKIYFL